MTVDGTRGNRREGRRTRPLRHRAMASNRVMPSSREEKKFAQIGAIGLVRREIRRLSGKFFLGAVQAVRDGEGRRGTLAARSRANVSRAMPKKKKRVLPMFFFRRMSFVRAARFRSRHVAAATTAFRYRPPPPAGKKKFREGVDT